MTYNWHLLAYYIRKPCKLCKLNAELQETIYSAFQRRATLREVVGILAQHGVNATERQVWTHKKHMRLLIEKTTAQQRDSESLKLKNLQLQVEQLKLARTKDELANAVLNALKELVSREQYSRIISIIQEEQHEND